MILVDVLQSVRLRPSQPTRLPLSLAPGARAQETYGGGDVWKSVLSDDLRDDGL